VSTAAHARQGLQDRLDDAIASLDGANPTREMLIVPRRPTDAPSGLGLSDSARHLYRWLLGHNRQVIKAYLSQPARVLNCSIKTIERAVDDLEDEIGLEFRSGPARLDGSSLAVYGAKRVHSACSRDGVARGDRV
jgi:hypothetical protein